MSRLFIIVAVLLIAAPAIIAAPPTSQPRPAAGGLNTMILGVQFANTKLADAVYSLSHLGNANILLDPQALKDAGVTNDTPITLSIQRKTLRQALDLLCAKITKDDHKFVNGPVGSVNLITSPPLLLRARKQNDADAAKATDANGLKRPLSPFSSTQSSIPLSDVLDFLHNVSNVKLTVDWNALESAGISKKAPIELRLVHDAPTYQVLRCILNQAQTQAKNTTLDFTPAADGTVTIAIAPSPG